MGRQRKGLPISGWLVIDKPLGMTSTQVVGKVRWLTKAQKVGHAGTLDPAATGVLPIALGEATKTVAYAMDCRKTYRFTVRWGIATDSDDAEGTAIGTSDIRPSPSQIAAILPAFTGTLDQMPPVYSALKIDGQRAYALARAGETVTLKPRPVDIHTMTLAETPNADHAVFEANVGKGTYIRSLARDMAVALGTLGHIVQLQRVNVGKFDLAHAISLETLEQAVQDAALDAYLQPARTALDDIPALALTEAETGRLRQGQTLSLSSRSDADRLPPLGHDGKAMALALLGDTPVALVEVSGAALRPVRVFNL